MAKTKLNITFHNPNTPEETVKLITAVVAKLASEKLHKIILEESQEKTSFA